MKATRTTRLASLSGILHFWEAESPALVETHHRILETIEEKGPEAAEAVANTYIELGDSYLQQRYPAGRGAHHSRLYRLARGGLLIQLAAIWKEADPSRPTVRHFFLAQLDQAIDYCQRMRWQSVVTALETEKKSLQNANT